MRSCGIHLRAISQEMFKIPTSLIWDWKLLIQYYCHQPPRGQWLKSHPQKLMTIDPIHQLEMKNWYIFAFHYHLIDRCQNVSFAIQTSVKLTEMDHWDLKWRAITNQLRQIRVVNSSILSDADHGWVESWPQLTTVTWPHICTLISTMA